LLTVTENIEEKTLTINSRVWFQKSSPQFDRISPLYKYKDEIYVYGIREFPKFKKFYKGLWKLNQNTGDWDRWFVSKTEGFEDDDCSCVFYEDKLYYFSSGELWIIDMRLANWKMVRIGKAVFSSGGRCNLVPYGGEVYLFVGKSMKTGKELKQSGFYKYHQVEDKWVRVHFRGESPPIISSHICVLYQANLFALNPEFQTNQISRIVLDFNEFEINRQKLFMNKESSDITIIVEEKEFYCHKFILSNASQFFHSMFNSGMKESIDKEISIPDVQASIFEALLRYIYCVDFEIKLKIALDLCRLSDQWLIRDLHADCVDFLGQNLRISNFGQIAELAEDIREEGLLEAATDFGSKKNEELKEKHLENLRDLRKKELKRIKRGKVSPEKISYAEIFSTEVKMEESFL